MPFAAVARVLFVFALVGVFWKRQQSKCWSFVAYLLATLVLGGLMSLWPARFWNWPFWLFSRYTYAGLKVLIALELGAQVFRAFPGAKVVARSFNLAMVFLLAVLMAALPSSADFGPFWTQAHLRLTTWTVWMFAGMAILVGWYNLPLDRWYRALMGGFAVQLVLGAVVLSLSTRMKWVAFERFGVVLDAVVATWWAYVAWRPVRVPVAAVDFANAESGLVGRSEARA